MAFSIDNSFNQTNRTPSLSTQRESDRIVSERIEAGAYKNQNPHACDFYDPLNSTEGICALNGRTVCINAGCTNPEKCRDYLDHMEKLKTAQDKR